jgi:hypothetical protein
MAAVFEGLIKQFQLGVVQSVIVGVKHIDDCVVVNANEPVASRRPGICGFARSDHPHKHSNFHIAPCQLRQREYTENQLVVQRISGRIIDICLLCHPQFFEEFLEVLVAVTVIADEGHYQNRLVFGLNVRGT